MSHLEVGRAFKTLKEVEDFIKVVEKEEFIQLYKRDTKKITSMRKTCPRKCSGANPELVYYMVAYACYKGGQKYRCKGVGKRNRSTFREDCPMRLNFTLSSNGQELILSNVENKHNHDVDETVFTLLPKQRRKLNADERSKVLKLKQHKCDKMLARNTTENDLDEVLNILQEEPESYVEIMTNENNVLEGIFFQNAQMRDYFSVYPELLMLEALYKLRIPLYILLTVDGNGEGIVVGTFILKSENSASITYMIDVFKRENLRWIQTHTILTTKDFNERNCLSQEFPNAKLSFFHSFHPIIAGINANEREAVLSILHKLANSKNYDQYEKNYNALVELNLPLVTKYFNDNWKNCKEDWVQDCCTFGVSTTNRLELFNRKIKAVCSKRNSLQDFYREFLVLLKSTYLDRKERAAQMIFKKPTVIIPHSVEDKYFKLVTPFAFEHIKQSLIKSKKVKVVVANSNEKTCQCSFYKDMKLPCKHIIKFRANKRMDLYNADLVPDRYKKHTYLQHYVIKVERIESCTNIVSEVHIQSTNEAILTQQQKYSKAIRKCQELAAIMCDMSNENFVEHYSQLENLIKKWESVNS